MDSEHTDDAPLPGWWGKIPGAGDFVGRRLPPSFIEPWDRWLSTELQHLKNSDQTWQERYLNGPVWWFALGEGMLDDHAWIGVLTPSVDRVGRCFPFTIAGRAIGELKKSEGSPFEQNSTRALLLKLEQLALYALDVDLSPNQVDLEISLHVSQLNSTCHAYANPQIGSWTSKLVPCWQSIDLPNAESLWPRC